MNFTWFVSPYENNAPNERLAVAKIVLYTLTSLDGATQDPHRYFPETGGRTGPPCSTRSSPASRRT